MNIIISGKFFGTSYDGLGQRPMPGFPDWDRKNQGELLDKGLLILVPEGDPVQKPEVSKDIPVGARLFVIDEDVYAFTSRDPHHGPQNLSVEKGDAPRGSVSPNFSWNNEVGLVWHTSFTDLEEAKNAMREWMRDELGWDINEGKYHHGKGKYRSDPPPPEGFHYLELHSSNDGHSLSLAIPLQWSRIFREKIVVGRNKELDEHPPQALLPPGTLFFKRSWKKDEEGWKDLLTALQAGEIDCTFFAVATGFVDNPKLREMDM